MMGNGLKRLKSPRLDEWYLCPDPAFSTLTKQDAPSIQDTVMCGLLIRRASRYYAPRL